MPTSLASRRSPVAEATIVITDKTAKISPRTKGYVVYQGDEGMDPAGRW